MVSNLGHNWQLSGAIMAGALMFGIAYAAFVHQYGRKLEGYVWLLVAIGVGATLMFGLFINATPLDMFVLFACSGAPMAAGNIYDHIRRREEYRVERERALSRIIGEMREDD